MSPGGTRTTVSPTHSRSQFEAAPEVPAVLQGPASLSPLRRPSQRLDMALRRHRDGDLVEPAPTALTATKVWVCLWEPPPLITMHCSGLHCPVRVECLDYAV